MKLLVLASLVALCAGCILPPGKQGDNSQYVPGKSRCIWFPSEDGKPVLVDLDAPVDSSFIRAHHGTFNAYWLFTRSNPTKAQVLVYEDAKSVKASNYNPKLPTAVITHGWNNNGNSKSVTAIRDAYLAVTDMNIIVLDWRRLSGNVNYATAVDGVPNIGEYAGKFMIWLFKTAGGDWNKLHMMGHSLGAHVVGNAGRTINGRASRVTGIDPAGPLWINNTYSLRASDAQYVECIHTDGGQLGIRNDICKANFYPNGGDNPQPGCLFSICSHLRAPLLMASSVRADRFTGKRCLNLQQAKDEKCTGSTFNMGNYIVDKRGSGLYGLTTSDTWPYYLSATS